MAVKEIHLVSHTHTDFGFTDYPDTLFRHHNRIIDRAIEVCEAEAERDDERARFRWTCEVGATTAHWFRTASSRRRDRFLALHRAGLMAAGGMHVHWTPLVSPANAARSMHSIDFLRRECGLDIGVAWQCDVNGLSWPWVDLLIDMQMDGLVVAPNPHRGMPFETQQRVFNWQAPSGRTLFTLHGWHYSVGAWGFFLGDDEMDRTQAAIDRILGNLEARGGYGFETLLCQVTNPAAIDNGYPTNVSAFVERWNAEGRTPALRLSTLDQAVAALKADSAMEAAPTWRGDWPDYWVDGVGSTAYETGLARASERQLGALELIGALRGTGESELVPRAAEALQFYDEHTWGAFCSAISPDSPFTRSHRSWKTARAYEGFSLVEEALADEARSLARERTGGPVENDFPIRRGEEGPTAIEEQSYYLLNPTSHPLSVRWPVTWDYGGAAPQTILHAHLCEAFHPGMKVDKPGFESSSTHLIVADLPPFAEAVVKPTPVADDPDTQIGENWIETGFMRLEVDPADGAIASLVRKADGQECVAPERPLGRLIYESLADPAKGRASIFGETGDWQYDWSRLETIAWPKTPPVFDRRTAASVRIGQARKTLLGPEIDVDLKWDHGDAATVTYRLHAGSGHVDVRVAIDKQSIEAPESMHMLFGTAGSAPRYEFDIGELGIVHDRDQIPESCRAWTAVQGHACVATDDQTLVVASPDAPLVQASGIHTHAPTAPEGDDPLLAFWLLNNHWDVNFAAAQTSRRLTYRFHLAFPQDEDSFDARGFAQDVTTVPVIVRAYDAAPFTPRSVVELDDKALIARLRRAARSDDLVLTITNPTDEARTATIGLKDAEITSVVQVDVTEEPLASPSTAAGAARVEAPAGTSRHHLLRIAAG